MTYQSSEQSSSKIHLPADVDWGMLDKSRFFIIGAALFSGVSGTLYPIMVLKTRQQVCPSASSSCFKLCSNILRQEGIAGFYRGFPTSLLGTIPARVLYMSTLEITKSTVADTALRLGLSDPSVAAASNAIGGLTASVAAQLVWTPVDVISQRLMVQGPKSANHTDSDSKNMQCHGRSVSNPNVSECHRGGKAFNVVRYRGGLDAFTSIIKAEGCWGLYRGFGLSILTYAPSNALWWGSYCLAQRTMWANLGYYKSSPVDCQMPSSSLVVGVQGASAACAAGVTALLTTPLDTIKTRLQVLARTGSKKPTIRETINSLVEEGGWQACYRGLGPRWTMMVLSAITMITTYESVKRLSKKESI